MAAIQGHPTVELSITLKLNEQEALALYDITSYGAHEFLKVFYEKIGESELQKHEDGLISLFQTVNMVLPPILVAVKKVQSEFDVMNGFKKRV